METQAPYAPPIAVKVMRVSAATLATRSIPMFETTAEGATEPSTPASVMTWDPTVWDATQTSYAQGSEVPMPTDILPLREASWTDQLMLPSSFGTVAVGQTFQAVVCVANTGSVPLSGVRIVLTMHSEATDKFVATSRELGTTDVLAPLAPQAQHCLVATHTLEAMAPHALVCRIRTDLRVQVRNVSERPLFLDTLSLETDGTWDVHAEPLDTSPLLPQDIRQYLCTLTPKHEVTWPLLLTQRDALAALPPQSTTLPLSLRLGHVLVAWRGACGSGRSRA
ncbi:hypothetical protein MEQU1_000669 [Malassezia equina]|uniref:Trafficking protein particle complex subunit 13 N-terminal domain-containing protein n=1 Tax=Malassezia equina TaxID=1381935 RepID=A0AAF0EGP2_9BASI|nr:hypothetical protein MEQU1_000669 [Malassezia equina]